MVFSPQTQEMEERVMEIMRSLKALIRPDLEEEAIAQVLDSLGDLILWQFREAQNTRQIVKGLELTLELTLESALRAQEGSVQVPQEVYEALCNFFKAYLWFLEYNQAGETPEAKAKREIVEAYLASSKPPA